MIYLNENEEKIIGKFMDVEEEHVGETLTLVWSDGSSVTAKYDSFIDDENDCELDEEGYEEFTSFVFVMVDRDGEPPIEVSQDGFFLVNYHNYPKDIVSNDERIN